MAYAIPTGGILEVTIEGKMDDQQVMNVYHYYMEKEGGVDDGKASAIAVGNWFANAGLQLQTWLDCVTNQVDEIEVYVQWITPNRYAYVQIAGGPHTGAVLLDSMPSNVQASITLKGEEAGRHNIGRKAMPGVAFDWVTNSIINLGDRGTYNVHAETLKQDFVGPEGENYYPVIFNRTTPELSPIITEAFVQPTIRIERRRTVGLGS